MKKKILFLAIAYIVALFAVASPVSAQSQDDEYREALKKIMQASGSTAATDSILPQILSMTKKMLPNVDSSFWNEFVNKWKTKIEEKVMEVYVPVYQQHLTMNDLKEIIAFYESPIGKKLRKTIPAITKETFPLMQQLGRDMGMEIMQKTNEFNVVPHNSQAEENRKRDQELYDAAYTIPKDSIEVSDVVYERGMDTKPSIYSIERRKDDTKVTFLVPIYFDWQWLHFSPGFKIVDKASGDEYHVRGYDGGAPFGKLLIVQGFNEKYIYVSLLFPKLKKSVKEIDILELPHEKDVIPSNDDGRPKSYYNIKLKDYVVSAKKNKKTYF